MRAPSADELLRVWEWGQRHGPLERGQALLAASCPDEAADHLLDLTIGQRDLRLLRLREALFGPQIDCQIACPACGDSLELAFNTRDLTALATSSPPGPPSAPLALDANGWHVQFRLLTCRDLLEGVRGGDAASRRRALLERCVISSVPADPLPVEIETALVAEMERADGSSVVDVALTCPSCAHTWAAPFDIVSVLWRELDAWAYRTLRDVHVLASAYGWSEPEVLALSAWRRDAYLQMTGHA